MSFDSIGTSNGHANFVTDYTLFFVMLPYSLKSRYNDSGGMIDAFRSAVSFSQWIPGSAYAIITFI